MDLPAILTPHTVTVEAYRGDSAYGPVYDQATTSRAYVEDKRRLVRDATGRQVAATTTVWLPLSVGDVPPQSRITVNEVARTALTVDRFQHPLAPSHIEVTLQ